MSPPDGNSTLTLNDSHDDEDKMRAALGLAPREGAVQSANLRRGATQVWT